MIEILCDNGLRDLCVCASSFNRAISISFAEILSGVVGEMKLSSNTSPCINATGKVSAVSLNKSKPRKADQCYS